MLFLLNVLAEEILFTCFVYLRTAGGTCYQESRTVSEDIFWLRNLRYVGTIFRQILQETSYIR